MKDVEMLFNVAGFLSHICLVTFSIRNTDNNGCIGNVQGPEVKSLCTACGTDTFTDADKLIHLYGKKFWYP